MKKLGLFGREAGRVVACLVDPFLVAAEEAAVFLDQPDIPLHSKSDQRGCNRAVIEAALQDVAERGGWEVIGRRKEGDDGSLARVPADAEPGAAIIGQQPDEAAGGEQPGKPVGDLGHQAGRGGGRIYDALRPADSDGHPFVWA